MITAPKKDYYKVHHLDCNTDDMQLIKTFPYCAKQNRQKLPALLYTEPPLNRIDPQTGATNEAKQHQYQGTLSDKSLFDFAVQFLFQNRPLMKAFSISLKKVKDFNSFVENNNEVPNIVYFTDKDKLPTIFKALTARFRNTIAFGHSMKDSQLATHFNITKYPTMMFNGKQEIPLSKNLTEMIQRLETIEGQHTQIVVAEFTEGLQELNSQNLQKLVYELPQHILIHVSDSSGEVHPQWKKCQQNFRNMFKYYETQTLSKQLGVKQTPAIVYFPKSLAKKSVQKSVFFPKDTFRTIYDEVASLIQDFTVPLANDMQMQKLTSIPLQQGKFIAVLFHEEEISLSYRVLSNDQDYKKDIVFFRMKDPQASVLQKFKINKLPALYVMMNNQEEEVQGKKKKKQEDLPEGRMQMNLQIAQYTGKFNFDDLTKYFSMFSKKPKVTQQPTSQHTQSVNIPQIDSLKQFQKHCIDENCYILLVDGRQSHKQSNQNYLNEIKKFAGRVNSNFAVLDAVCHAEILTPLDIQLEELPVFIHLNGKFEKYARLIGRIEEKTLNGFIAKTRANKANYRAFNNLQFDDLKDCSQEHRKLDQYQSGTDSEPALDAAQLQILKEIQQQEKKKQQQAKIQKQNEKNEKKKKRKRRPKGQEDSYDL